jgi:hypothetical protein
MRANANKRVLSNTARSSVLATSTSTSPFFNIPTSRKINPNDNLFKNDVKYKLKEELVFDSKQDEESAIKDMSARYRDYASQVVPIYLFFFIFESNTSYIITSIAVIIGSLSYLILNGKISINLSTTNRNFILRILCDALVILKIYNFSSIQELTCEYMFSLLFPGVVFAIIYELSFKLSLWIFLLKSCLLLTKPVGHEESYLIMKLIYNIFSAKIFVVLYITTFLMSTEYMIRKGLRELWALYDSFKRSFFMMKNCLLDESPIPTIVVLNKKPTYAIKYFNEQGKKLLSKFFDNINMITSIEQLASSPELLKFFNCEIDKCLTQKKKSFNFPLRRNRDSTLIVLKETQNKQFRYKGDYSQLDWYKVVVSPCKWKSQDSLIIQLIKNYDIPMNDFIGKYQLEVAQQQSSILDNIDSICYKITEFEYEKMKEREKRNAEARIEERIRNSPDGIKISPDTDSLAAKKVTKSFSYISFPQYDHSIWLFFKYNTNLVYDLKLSIELYYSIMKKSYNDAEHRVKLKDFINYFNEYFSFFASKIKNFRFAFKNVPDDEIVINYYYLRALLFNVIHFILNNSNSEVELKWVDIIVSIDDSCNYKFEITYTDEKVKIDYNKVADILSIKINSDTRSELSKVKILDIGIVLVDYIVKYIYNGKLVLTSNNYLHKIQFTIIAEDIINDENYKFYEEWPLIKLKEPRTRIFDLYHSKILEKIYKINPTKFEVREKLDGVKEKLDKLKLEDTISKGFTFTKSKGSFRDTK